MFHVEQCAEARKFKICGIIPRSSRRASGTGPSCACQKEPSQRKWHRDGLAPLPSLYFLDFWQVPGSNPEDDLLRCNLFRVRPLEKGCKFPQRSRTDEIERRNFLAQLLIAADQDASVSKSKITNDFRKKCRFLDIRFNEDNLQFRPDNLERQTGKTGSRTHVGEPTILYRHS